MRFHAGFIFPAGTIAVANRMVAVANGGAIFASADGNTWTSRATGLASTVGAVAAKTGLYVIGGALGRIFTSSDTVTWTSRTSGVTDFINNLLWSGSKFVATSNGYILDSTDGVTWTSRSVGAGFVVSTDAIQGIAYSGSTFAIMSNTTNRWASSSDGVTWTSRVSPFGTNNNSRNYMLFANGKFVACGAGGQIASSADGITWTSRAAGSFTSSDGITMISFGGGVFVAVGVNNKISTSSDATTWTSRTSGLGALTSWSGVAFGFSKHITMAGGAPALIADSADGVTWTSRANSVVNFVNSMFYGGG